MTHLGWVLCHFIAERIPGDLLRLDLDLEAHLGSTLEPSSAIILEKARQ